MATFDEVYNKYKAKNKDEEEKSYFDEVYNKYKPQGAYSRANQEAEMKRQEEQKRQSEFEKRRIKAPSGPYQTIWDKQLVPTAEQVKQSNEQKAQANEVQTQKQSEQKAVNNFVNAKSADPFKAAKIEGINNRYQSKVSKDSKTQQGEDAKARYQREAQIEKEIELLELMVKEEESKYDPALQGLQPVPGITRGSTKPKFSKSETEQMLETQKAELKKIKAQNQPYRMNDIINDGTYNVDLEEMYTHRNEPDFIQKYGARIAQNGLDVNALYNQYYNKKISEILTNPDVSRLVSAMYEAEIKSEDDALRMMYNPNSYNPWASALTSGTQSEGIDARNKLIEMGYNPDELFEKYSLEQNEQASQAMSEYAYELGQDHPIGTTALSLLTNLSSPLGLVEVGKSALTGREIDPNSRFFAPINVTSNIREGAKTNYSKEGQFVYDIATTVGDMAASYALSSGFGPASKTTFVVTQATQAAANTAREGALKGYGKEQIIINSVVSGAVTAFFAKKGFDKVFAPGNAETLKEVASNVAEAFFAEGGEEAIEEAADLLAQNITNVIFNNQTEIQAEVDKLVTQGYSLDDAFTQVLSSYGEQIGTSFVMGGLAGGIINSVNNVANYNYNRNTNVAQTQNPAISPQNEPIIDTNNQVSPPAETNAPTGEFQPVTQAESVDPEYDFEEIDNGEVDFETESNEPYDEYAEYLSGFEQYIAEYDDMLNNPTSENVGRVSQEIKTEFDSENYDGVTEERVVPYTSGNSAVDAFVNADGRLDTKITVDAQAEQNLINKAQNMFNRTVRFVDTLDGANAYFDRNTNEIVIARDSQMKSVSAFGHEFAHSLEGTLEYTELKTHLMQNSSLIKARLAEVGNNWNKLVDKKITEYQNALGKTLSRSEAEYEIIADAIGTELFSDYKAMESLATQNRSLFTKFKQWFVRNFIGTRETRRKISNPKAAALKTYALMLRAEKAAMNRTQSDDNNKKYSVITTSDGKQYVKADRQVISGDDSSKWGKQVTDYINTSIRKGKNVVVYAKDGDALTITRDTAGKAAFRNQITNPDGSKRTMTDDEYAVKLRAESHIDEISETSVRGNTTVPDTKKHTFAKDGFNYRTAYFLDFDGSYYRLTLSVGKNGAINTVYNVGKIKEARTPFSGSKAVADKTATTVTASSNSIPNSSENVNNDVSYSAKKSETVQRIIDNFNYNDVTANNIIKAARSLKQKADSKADLKELAYMIAQTLENRRTGNTDSTDAERIAMMLAEDAKVLNEDFIAENKPILDRLNGMTISISEADISDLGDAFSYVKSKLFPYVTLTKGTDSSVDSIFQDLAAEFPFAFDAEAVTHPADQVKAIMGFIEDYRNNKYYRPYFEDSEAFSYLRTEIENMLSDTKVDEASYLGKLEQLVEKYGELKNGVPKSTDGETKVRRAAASFYGSKPVIENPELAERFAKEIVNGKYDYEIMRQGKLATRYLDQIKASDNVTEKVIEEYKRLYSLLTDRDYRVTPTDVLQAAALNPMLAEVLDADDFVNYTMLVSEVGTSAGQIISSLRLINQFSPPQVLKAIQKKIDRINQKQSSHYTDEIETDAVADGNGQFASEDAPQPPKGVMEFIVTRRKAKYPPIDIPAELQQELLRSRSRDETEAATEKIMQYVGNQMHYSWFDKISSIRYLSMLLNPKTAIKNTLGNASMSAVARGKDVVAAGLSRLPIANKYKGSSTQTTSAVTSKEARKAALTLLGDSQGVVSLFSGKDKYTGKESLSSKSDAKLNKSEKKLAEMNPLIEVMLNNRSIQSTPLANSKVPIVGKAFEKISDFQQKTLDDTPFKILRAKTVLAQSITAAVNSGDIQNIDDFVAVALNQNTEHLDNATKIKYAQLYDKFCAQAAKEGDEATFRENNKLADKINKLRQGKNIWGKAGAALIDGAFPFVKTPANVAKRSLEYSPLGLGKSLIGDRYKLAKGEIDRNTYINNLAKGLTGTSIFALGALLSAFGVISTDDGGDEEEKAEKQLLGGQNYAINIGNGSYTIDFLSPTSVPLFMGGKVYDEILKATNGEEVTALEALFEVMMGVTGPLFAQTMLSGIDGALESVSRETAYGENEGGRRVAALANYCAESWISQFMPTVLGAIARTADDTVRTYYNDGTNDNAIIGALGYMVKKRVPGVNQTLPAKLDMWGQPIKSGNLPERFIENFISPGYWEEDNTDKATKALHSFATANDINYSDIIPKKPGNKLKLTNHKEITLTADEYEIYAGEIGKARKDAVEKYLVNGEDVEVAFTYYTIDLTKKSGFATHKYTYKGPLKTAENTVGWAPDKGDYGYYVYDDTGKPIAIRPASNKEFRAMLFEKVMEQATEEGKGKAIERIEAKH